MDMNPTQQEIANYITNTGCDFKARHLNSEYWEGWHGDASSFISDPECEVAVALTLFGLPSHLPPANPANLSAEQITEDGKYRAVTAKDSCNQPHEIWNPYRKFWINGYEVPCDFEGQNHTHRVPASTPFPDWEEMSKEPGDQIATNATQPVEGEQKDGVTKSEPDTFVAHGKAWTQHTPGDPRPCDGEIKVEVLLRSGEISPWGVSLAIRFNWGSSIYEYGIMPGDIIGWRYADTQPAPEAVVPVSGWQPIETAPSEGVFLVYLEKEMLSSRVHSTRWRSNVKVIGGLLHFECPKPTHWMPLPNPPQP